VRRRVRAELGLPIPIGVARTKHLAKIASQVAKPDGLMVVDPEAELDFLHDLPVELMWGVGPVRVEGEGASVLRQGRRHGGPGQSQRSSRGGRHKKETERLALQRIGRRSGSRSGPKPVTPDTAIWLNLERFPAATASSVILPARLATPLAYRLLAARDGLQSSLH
jgi:DNA polymerase-4